jgi:hypothetical protein
MAAEKNIVEQVKYTLIFENLRATGGVRQALVLARALMKENTVVICLVKREKNSLRSIAGFLKDVVIALNMKPKGMTLRILLKPIEASAENTIITTSKSTLNWVSNIQSNWHWHYFQHIEVWQTLNSSEFEGYCINNGYPSSKEFNNFLTSHYHEDDRCYLANLESTQNFMTVSEFLKHFLIERNKQATIKLMPVIPHINTRGCVTSEKDIDLLLILRGSRFKGDALTLEILSHYASTEKNIAVIVSQGKKPSLVNKNVSYYLKPSDAKLAELYSRAKLTVHPSLLEGFGSVPQEALAFGSFVVCSNTGWLLENQPEYLVKVFHHCVKYYIESIEEFFSNRDFQ